MEDALLAMRPDTLGVLGQPCDTLGCGHLRRGRLVCFPPTTMTFDLVSHLSSLHSINKDGVCQYD